MYFSQMFVFSFDITNRLVVQEDYSIDWNEEIHHFLLQYIQTEKVESWKKLKTITFNAYVMTSGLNMRHVVGQRKTM